MSMHRFAVLLLMGLYGSPTLSLAAPATAEASCSVVSKSDAVAVLVCPGTSDNVAWRAAGQAACKGRSLCNAWIWTDPQAAPAKAPARDADFPKTAAAAARAVWVQDSQMLILVNKAK